MDPYLDWADMFEEFWAVPGTVTKSFVVRPHKHKQENSGVLDLFVQHISEIEHTIGSYLVVAAVVFRQNSFDFEQVTGVSVERQLCLIAEHLIAQLTLISTVILDLVEQIYFQIVVHKVDRKANYMWSGPLPVLVADQAVEN